MLFENLNIIDPILKALKEDGYIQPTPIQEKSIPFILAGRDFLGCAQTGTGKTAAFAIPIIQNIINEQKIAKGKKVIRALILAPTRELAIQTGENFAFYGKYTDVKSVVIFGGVPQSKQVNALRAGADVLIATPGRLLDLIDQKYINLHNVMHFVLDEADRMLDMGMIHDVKKIIAQMPKIRQNMLFSATMPREISKLVDSILKDPERVEVTPVSSTLDTITQGMYFVDKNNKKALLAHLLKDETIVSALVFSRTKHGANNITKDLAKVGIEAEAIHGNKSQNARQLALSNFKEGKTRVLVATDIAARGIDVNELSHVINYNLPEVPETYVHRIGRTGRAGLSGIALSFCDVDEKEYLRGIEKLIKKTIPVMEDNPYPLSENAVPSIKKDFRREFKKDVNKNAPSTKRSRQSTYSNKRKKSSEDSDRKYR